MIKRVSPRMRKILEMLKVRRMKGQFAPSVREIGEACEISSTSVVTFYLDKLEDMGLVSRERGISRSLAITDSGLMRLGGAVCPTCGQSLTSHRVAPAKPANIRTYAG